MRLQRVDDAVRQHHKLLVCGRFQIKRHAVPRQDLLQLHGPVNAVLPQPGIQLVCKQRVKLHAQQPALCQQAAVLFGPVQKVRGHPAAGEDRRLAAQRADLGAADIKRVAQSVQILQRYVALRACQRIAKPCPVQKQLEIIFSAKRADVGKLLLGIQRAPLCGVRQIHHARPDQVLAVFVAVKGGKIVCKLPGVQLAQMLGQGQDLVAHGLDCAGLVAVDVPGLGCQNALPALQQARGHNGVRLRAA